MTQNSESHLDKVLTDITQDFKIAIQNTFLDTELHIIN